MELADLVVAVADDLKSDGLDAWSERLLTASNGVFNNTELVMKWRFHTEHILRLKSLSERTREHANALFEMLDRVLQ